MSMIKLTTKILIFFLSMVVCLNAGNTNPDPSPFGEVINCNPDPLGEPWWAGGAPERFSEEQLEKIASLPTLDFSSRKIILPDKLDNSSQKYFRPIFRQQGGSCAQASGVGYNFTYEVNYEQNTSADIMQNQFPSHYTWNYLNDGVGHGSITEDGWEIIKANGCPNVLTFGGMTGDDSTNTIWMNEYQKYLNGMNRRVVSMSKIVISTPDGINTLKQWFFDHGNGEKAGGIVNFSCLVLDTAGKHLVLDTLPDGTEEAGKLVVPQWGVRGGHAMVLVGYNDSIRFDVNNDGKFTNDIDINGDSVVNVKDWEIGAYKVANSWGTKWGNEGFVYMLYRVGALPPSEGGLTASNSARCIRVQNDYKMKLVYKINIKHNIRNKIKLIAGISNDTAAEKPEFAYHFPIMSYQGGEHPLVGKYMSDEMTVGLDVNPLLEYLSSKKVKLFLIVNSAGGSGKVISFSTMEYRNPINVQEIKCAQTNVEIKHGTNIMTIMYEPKINDLVIKTDKLPLAKVNEDYKVELKASGGKEPYKWTVLKNLYTETGDTAAFPEIKDSILKPDNNDDGIAEKKIEFEFPFYGEKFKTIYISTDGSILFSPGFEYIRSRSAIIQNKVITPFGGDLTFELDGDDMYFEGKSDYAIVRWNTTKFWGNENKVNVDVAAKLFPSGKIQFFYNKDLTNGIFGLGYGFSKGNGEDYHILDIDNSGQIPDNYVYEFESAKLPDGIEVKENGTISGKPTIDNKSWDIIIICTDANGVSKRKTFVFSTEKPTSLLDNPLVRNIRGFQYHTNGSKVIISYKTQRTSKVKCDILNISGRTIKTLENSYKKAGHHSITLNLKNNLAHGLYLCKLTVGKESLVKRLLFVK